MITFYLGQQLELKNFARNYSQPCTVTLTTMNLNPREGEGLAPSLQSATTLHYQFTQTRLCQPHQLDPNLNGYYTLLHSY